jgi:hypothetical protein
VTSSPACFSHGRRTAAVVASALVATLAAALLVGLPLADAAQHDSAAQAEADQKPPAAGVEGAITAGATGGVAVGAASLADAVAAAKPAKPASGPEGPAAPTAPATDPAPAPAPGAEDGHDQDEGDQDGDHQDGAPAVPAPTEAAPPAEADGAKVLLVQPDALANVAAGQDGQDCPPPPGGGQGGDADGDGACDGEPTVTPGPGSETQPPRPPPPTATPEPSPQLPPVVDPSAPPDPVVGQFQAAQPPAAGAGTVDVVLDVHIYDRGLPNSEASKAVTVRVPAGQGPAVPDQIVVDGRTYTRASPTGPITPGGQGQPATVTYDKDLNWGESALKAVVDEWDRQTTRLSDWWTDFTADPAAALRCVFSACPAPPGPPGKSPNQNAGGGTKDLPVQIPWPGESALDD